MKSLLSLASTTLVVACSIVLYAEEQAFPESALGWQPKEYPEADLHPRIVFLKPERQWERMDVWVPKAPADGRLPCVVAVFGGGYGDKVGGFINDARPLLERGFVVAAPDDALQTDAPVPLCAWDVAAAIRYLRHHADEYRIDPERIGAWGWSAGGWIAQDLCYAGPERMIYAPVKAGNQHVSRWFPMIDPHPQFPEQ
jgi:acetyl esterase/lipase